MTAATSRAFANAQRTITERAFAGLALEATKAAGGDLRPGVRTMNGICFKQHRAIERLSDAVSLGAAVRYMEMRHVHA